MLSKLKQLLKTILDDLISCNNSYSSYSTKSNIKYSPENFFIINIFFLSLFLSFFLWLNESHSSRNLMLPSLLTPFLINRTKAIWSSEEREKQIDKKNCLNKLMYLTFFQDVFHDLWSFCGSPWIRIYGIRIVLFRTVVIYNQRHMPFNLWIFYF